MRGRRQAQCVQNKHIKSTSKGRSTNTRLVCIVPISMYKHTDIMVTEEKEGVTAGNNSSGCNELHMNVKVL